MELVPRIQGILLKPKEEWVKIKAEQTSVKELFMSYVIILAAIPAIAQFIGWALVGGMRIPYIGRSIVGRTFLYSIFYYVASLVAVYIVGMVINMLAPNFASKQNPENAMKLIVYSFTPMWLAGVLNLIPFLAPLAFIASLYGLYILYLGFDAGLMETPKDKVMVYFVVSFLIAFVIMAVVSSVLMGIFFGGTLFRMF